MDKPRELLAKFKSRFGTPPTAAPSVFRAPGRVNLIGEHTDYNQGFVLPVAIGFSCWVAAAPRDDGKLVLHSENFNQSHQATLDQLTPAAPGHWFDYPLGVAWTLQQAGYRLRGANLYILGEVPIGAGLSSSAAVEVATGLALLAVSRHDVDRTKLALLCQRAENDFVGARTGIMDQFASCHARAGEALFLDCRSLDFRFLPLPLNVHLVICNTMVKHQLGTSEYNDRRAECEEAVSRLAHVIPPIHSLRDLTLSELDRNRGHLTDVLYRRARHVITENDRVRKFARALEARDVAALQPLLAESHRSLRDDYQVSCRELDIMVEIASRQPGVHGSRMTGGGFGGCTVNLVDAAKSAEFQRRVSADYLAATGLQPDIYICESSQGAAAVLPAEDVPSVSL
jgi:galactokinase